MNYYSNPTTKIHLPEATGNKRKYKSGVIAFFAILLLSFTVSAQDNTPPVLINSAIGCSSLDQQNVNECKSVAANFNGHTLESAVAALYQDPSGPVTATLLSTVDSCNCPCSWSFKYTFEIKDIFNNSVTCEVRRSGHDTSPPTFTLPANVTLYVDANCSVDISPQGPADSITNVTDNCGVYQVLWCDDCTRRGSTIINACEIVTIQRTWTVYDACNNKAEGTQTILIVDTIKPVFTIFPQNLTVSGCDNVLYNVEATDNCCSMVNLAYQLSGATTESDIGSGSGTNFNSGVTHVTITATDGTGNSRQQSFNVTINDNIPPVISVHNIHRQYAEDNYGCSISLGATATDNCALLSLTSDAPACFPVGSTTVTWTAIDIHNNVSTKTQIVTRIPPNIKITICAAVTRKIYRGSCNGVGPLGPQSVSLTTTVRGGIAPYTYLWTPATGLNNPNIPNPVANPSTTTTYTLTVTDAFQNYRSLSITIYVYQLSDDVVSGNGSTTRFKVCHINTGEHDKPVNRNVKRDDCNQHLNHNNGHDDCYLGDCDENCVSTPSGGGQNSRGGNTGNGSLNPNDLSKFMVNVSPNPSNREFLIQVFSTSDEPVTVRVFDYNGALKSVNSLVSGTSYVIVGGNWVSGMYFAEIRQGNNRKVLKLVKLN